MARKPRPSKNAGQFLLDMPVAEKAAPPPEFLPPVGHGVVVVRHHEMDAARFESLLARSNLESKDRGRKASEGIPAGEAAAENPSDHDEEPTDAEAEKGELATIAAIRQAAEQDAFEDNGDPLVTDSSGRLIEGIKRCMGLAQSGRILRIPVIQGVDPEARFSTDDTLKGHRARRMPPPPRSEPLPLTPVDLSLVAPGERKAIGEAMALRERICAALGGPVLGDWTPEKLASCAAKAGPVAGLSVPRHLAIASHALIAEIAPRETRTFMAHWAMPGTSGESPAKLLSSSPHRPDMQDDLDFLAVLALAIEAAVDGTTEDPYLLLRATRRSRDQLLRVLAGSPARAPARLIAYRKETFSVDEMAAALAEAGRAIDTWDAEERERIGPLVNDVRRDKGLVVTGQTVKFTDGGRLIDGFDRFAACVLAKVPAVTFVARGFRDGYDPVRAQGRKQSLGHRLYADGYIRPYDVAALLTNIHRMTENDREARVTNTLLRHLQNRRHPQAARSVMFVFDLKPFVEISAISPVHLAMSRFSRDLADSFCSELFSLWKGDLKPTLPRHQVLVKVVERLGELHANRKERDNDHAICILAQAINAWCREQPVPEFRKLPAKGFVKVMRPPQVDNLSARAGMGEAA